MQCHKSCHRDRLLGAGNAMHGTSDMDRSHVLICSSDSAAHLRKFIGVSFCPCHPYDDALHRASHQHGLYTAGPPCVRFSMLGARRGEPDRSTSTLGASIRHILRDRPKVFVLKNVLVLQSFDKGALLDEILLRLRDGGYNEVTAHVLDTRKHGGLPQSRRRLYLIGVSWFLHVAIPRLEAAVEHLSLSDVLNPRGVLDDCRRLPPTTQSTARTNVATSLPVLCQRVFLLTRPTGCWMLTRRLGELLCRARTALASPILGVKAFG